VNTFKNKVEKKILMVSNLEIFNKSGYSWIKEDSHEIFSNIGETSIIGHINRNSNALSNSVNKKYRIK
jgi:hypothetical protein